MKPKCLSSERRRVARYCSELRPAFFVHTPAHIYRMPRFRDDQACAICYRCFCLHCVGLGKNDPAELIEKTVAKFEYEIGDINWIFM